MKTRLTPFAINQAKPGKKPRKLTDGGGLFLEIRPKGPRSNGSKLWRYRYKLNGTENLYAVGEYAESPIGETSEQAETRRNGGGLTLEEARLERDRCRRLVKQGVHPLHQKEQEKARRAAASQNSLETVARAWMSKKAGKWSEGYAAAVKRALEADVFPVVGKLPISAITAGDLLPVLQNVEARSASAAVLIRVWLHGVFRHAIGQLAIKQNPVRDLSDAIEAPLVERHKPLALHEIPAFLQAVDTDTSTHATKLALRLLLLTFVRPGELRSAEWSEIDWDNSLWRIPGHKMKKDLDHLVPLSRQAIALLRELHDLTGRQSWLLPNIRQPKTYMSATTLNRALGRMGYKDRFTAHGFRATASTHLNEIGFDPDWVERQLAHVEGNRSRRAYNAAKYLDGRRAMMQQWADIATGSGKVVAIRAA